MSCSGIVQIIRAGVPFEGIDLPKIWILSILESSTTCAFVKMCPSIVTKKPDPMLIKSPFLLCPAIRTVAESASSISSAQESGTPKMSNRTPAQCLIRVIFVGIRQQT